MATLYGATLAKSPNKEANYDGGRVLGSNSAVFTANDPVNIDASGTLVVATATAEVYGIVQKTQTMTGNNVSGTLVRPVCIPVDQQYEFLMGTNSDLIQTGTMNSVGSYFKLTGATGLVQVDVASGSQTTTNRVVMCTEVDPNAVGGTGAGSGLRQGFFKFVRVPNYSDT